jgi:hypothetical protein
MALKPTYANVELTNGVVHEDVRITYGDRLRLEKTMKARGWDGERQPFTTSGFLAWAALERLGAYTGSYTEFLADVLDVQLDDTAADPAEPEDPTSGPAA